MARLSRFLTNKFTAVDQNLTASNPRDVSNTGRRRFMPTLKTVVSNRIL